MKNLQKSINLFFAFVVVLILGFIVYFASYQFIFPYVAIGSLDVQRIAQIAIREKDPSICSKIKKGFDLGPSPSEKELIGTCFLAVANETKDRPTCEKIPFPNRRNCIDSIAFAQNDISYCNETVGQFAKESCYEKFLLQGTSKSICKNIEDINEKDLCYFYAAKFSKDVNICSELVTTNHYKDQCYDVVAIETKNPLICDKIIDNTENVNCKRYVQSGIYQP